MSVHCWRYRGPTCICTARRRGRPASWATSPCRSSTWRRSRPSWRGRRRRREPGAVTPAATLPSGLVTFVLTDIEGSTKMFRRLGDSYPPLLETHNALLREQWAAHGGAEVKTVGDAFI